jgi:hypothetical protein
MNSIVRKRRSEACGPLRSSEFTHSCRSLTVFLVTRRLGSESRPVYPTAQFGRILVRPRARRNPNGIDATSTDRFATSGKWGAGIDVFTFCPERGGNGRAPPGLPKSGRWSSCTHLRPGRDKRRSRYFMQPIAGLHVGSLIDPGTLTSASTTRTGMDRSIRRTAPDTTWSSSPDSSPTSTGCASSRISSTQRRHGGRRRKHLHVVP